MVVAETKAEWARLHRWTQRMDSIVYLGGLCKDCGYKDNLDALEFDHVKPPQHPRRDLSSLFGCAGWEKIKAELDRCELVCSNCHSIRTALRRRENQRNE